MMAIRRNISVLNPGVVANIDIVYGSDLIPIEFYITDYALPDNAIATLYCTTAKNEVYKIVGNIANNVISFVHETGFFDVGANNIQIRITANEKNLYSFETKVNCKANMANDDAQEVESQPTLVTQLLTEVGEVKEVGNKNTEGLKKTNIELEKINNGLEDTKKQDTKENIVTFESVDALDDQEELSEWTEVDVLESGETHSSILGKISKMFKNIRYLYKKIVIGKYVTYTDGVLRDAKMKVIVGSKVLDATNKEYANLFTKSEMAGILGIEEVDVDNTKINVSAYNGDGNANGIHITSIDWYGGQYNVWYAYFNGNLTSKMRVNYMITYAEVGEQVE